MSEHERDDATAIELAEQARLGAQAARAMFNAYLSEGFTEAQSLSLVRANILSASNNTDA
jgi:hypothetical protein